MKTSKIMKTLIITSLLMVLGFSSVTAQAPNYTNFEWDIVRGGIAVPNGNDQINAGISFGGEVRFNLSNNISIGLGSDYTFFASENDAVDVGLTNNIVLVGDYYLKSTSSNRAFVGMGVGFGTEGDVLSGNNNTVLIESASGAILTPRIGYEFGHLRLMGSYNIGLKEGLSNFFSIGAGITLWGGYKG